MAYIDSKIEECKDSLKGIVNVSKFIQISFKYKINHFFESRLIIIINHLGFPN